MLNILLVHKIAIGRIVSVVGATATVVIFEYSFELAWYISVPVAVLAYVTQPITWTALLDSFVLRARPCVGSRLPAQADIGMSRSGWPLIGWAGSVRPPARFDQIMLCIGENSFALAKKCRLAGEICSSAVAHGSRVPLRPS